jgi:hypothetical protein
MLDDFIKDNILIKNYEDPAEQEISNYSAEDI